MGCWSRATSRFFGRTPTALIVAVFIVVVAGFDSRGINRVEAAEGGQSREYSRQKA
jgi:hypothetical protein